MARKLQPYNSVGQFFAKHNMASAKRDFWRLVDEDIIRLGQINGVSTVRGWAIATDGVIVALEDDHGRLSFGHLDWFVADPDSDSDEDLALTKTRKRNSKRTAILAEFL
jgi:hypothetical protein